MKKIMYFLLIILLIVLIAISSYFIYKQLKEENEQESIFNNLSEIIQDDIENRLKDNLKSNNYIKIQELAKLIREKEEFVVKDLNKMIDLGLFLEGHIDDEKIINQVNSALGVSFGSEA